jgi:hypothetical protein
MTVMEIPHPKHDGNKQEVLRGVIHCEVTNSYRNFEELFCLHLQGTVTDVWLLVTKMHGAARTYFRADSHTLSGWFNMQ